LRLRARRRWLARCRRRGPLAHPSGGRQAWAGVGTGWRGSGDAAQGPALVRAGRGVAPAVLGRLAFRAPGAQIATAAPASLREVGHLQAARTFVGAGARRQPVHAEGARARRKLLSAARIPLVLREGAVGLPVGTTRRGRRRRVRDRGGRRRRRGDGRNGATGGQRRGREQRADGAGARAGRPRGAGRGCHDL
jgi:hypothetical protein